MKLRKKMKKIIGVKQYQEQTGITLIALVITIVVLLILAGVSINVIFNDNGIIKKTQEAQNKTEQAKENDLTAINELNNGLEENGGIKNTTGGNTSGGEITTLPSEMVEENYTWTQNKTQVTGKHKTNGSIITKEVGENYDYDCGVSSYTGGWKILGAENGKLLIMSAKDIGILKMGGEEGYNTGVTQLDNMCKPYGTNARSIKVEDINRVTSYDPNKTGDGKKYGQGQMYEYGNKVTYTSSESTGTNGQKHSGKIFYEHPDGRRIGSNGFTSITQTSTYYSYYPDTLTKSSSGTTVGIEKTTPAYKLLFSNPDNKQYYLYYLASTCVESETEYSRFYIRCVKTSGAVDGICLCQPRN